MNSKKLLLIIVSSIVILFCVINIVRQIKGGGRKGFEPTGVQEEVGRALAEATSDHLGESGSVVILAVDDSQSPYPFAKKQVEAAADTFKSKGIEVQDTIWLMANQIMPEMGVMTVDLYMESMAPFKGVDGIVSFAGIPVPDPMQGRNQIAALKTMPPLYCVTRDRNTLTPMMKSGMVKVAVCEKGAAVDMSDGKKPKKPAEWFIAVYEVITSAPPVE